MTIDVLDPSHESRVAQLKLAPRPDSLAGATVGFISNGKEGTKGFFEHLESLMRDRFGVALVERHTKSNYSAPADTHVIEAAAGWRLAITGLGD